MRTDFSPIFHRVPLAAPLIGGGIGLLQGLIGGGQKKRANKELNRLFQQRELYQTPQEIYDIVNLAENNAQTGFSPETMGYLTSQADRGLSSSLDVARRLGADPNQLGATLDSYFQDIFRIGNENEMAKMKKFDSFTNALQLLAQNKDAEFASRESLLKDRMAMVGQKAQAGQTNIQSGTNLLANALGLLGSTGLFGDNSTKTGSGTTMSGQVI